VVVTAGFTSASVPVTITASYGAVTKTITLNVLPTAVSNLTLAGASVKGGRTVNATVTLNGPAPPGGASVALSSSDASASPPATATVPSGATSLTFAVATIPVTANTAATISATYGPVTKSVVLTVTP
jgi:hypothetical protein